MESLLSPGRQMRLGRSDSNELILIRPLPPPSADRGIFLLPDELLQQILSLAITPDDRYVAPRGPKPSTAAAAVCRRFNTIVTPLIYSDIGINMVILWYSNQAPMKGMQKLHRTLTETPSLRKYTRKLAPNTFYPGRDYDNESALPMLVDIATFLTDTRSMSLSFPSVSPQDDSEVFYAAVSHMPNLQKLEIGGWVEHNPQAASLGISLGLVCESLSSLSHLRELTISTAYPEMTKESSLEVSRPSSPAHRSATDMHPA